MNDAPGSDPVAESFPKIAADHDRLQYQVWNMERRLRAFMATSGND